MAAKGQPKTRFNGGALLCMSIPTISATPARWPIQAWWMIWWRIGQAASLCPTRKNPSWPRNHDAQDACALAALDAPHQHLVLTYRREHRTIWRAFCGVPRQLRQQFAARGVPNPSVIVAVGRRAGEHP